MQSASLRPSRRTRGLTSDPANPWGLKHFFTLAAALCALAGVVYGLNATGYLAKMGREITTQLVTLSANMGYRVSRVDVEGRYFLPITTLKGLVTVQKGDPLFGVDIHALQKNLAAQPWIKTVSAERHFPGRIYIALTERTPIALWQKTGKVQVIDAEGVALTSDLRGFTALPLVVGAGAEKTAADLLAQLSAEPTILQKLESASWVSNRRWDLALKNKMLIKLPEDNMGLALRRLADADRSDQILTKDISQIDLRQPDRMIVTARTGGTKDFTPTPSPGEKTKE